MSTSVLNPPFGDDSINLGTSYTEIKKARERIKPFIRQTPLWEISHAQNITPENNPLFLKLENLQLTGSFKIRGVYNRILTAPPSSLNAGLVAASGGNHGRAVAYAARALNLPCTVYVPKTTPIQKQQAIKNLSAKLIIQGNNLDESILLAQSFASTNGGLFIHPFGDLDVIHGQGTIALEMFEANKNIDTLLIAIGGGGLMCGMALAAKSIKPSIRIIGVEPMGCPTLYNSLKAEHVVPVENIQTTAGTLAIRETTPRNFNIIKNLVDEIVLVNDEEMQDAQNWLLKELSLNAEMAGVASLAAFLQGKILFKPAESLGILICGSGI